MNGKLANTAPIRDHRRDVENFNRLRKDFIGVPADSGPDLIFAVGLLLGGGYPGAAAAVAALADRTFDHVKVPQME